MTSRLELVLIRKSSSMNMTLWFDWWNWKSIMINDTTRLEYMVQRLPCFRFGFQCWGQNPVVESWWSPHVIHTLCQSKFQSLILWENLEFLISRRWKKKNKSLHFASEATYLETGGGLLLEFPITVRHLYDTLFKIHFSAMFDHVDVSENSGTPK